MSNVKKKELKIGRIYYVLGSRSVELLKIITKDSCLVKYLDEPKSKSKRDYTIHQKGATVRLSHRSLSETQWRKKEEKLEDDAE
jgi:hypothetical protein